MTIREMMTMYHSVKFVEELIDYIAEYPDDDYMTMECLCRKLFKYRLIDKKDGYYLVADGIKTDRKTEPQKKCHRDEEYACHLYPNEGACNNCKLWFEDEPQTNKDFEVTYTCSFTDCDNFKNFGFGEKCIECKRKQSEVKHKDE